MSSIEFDKYVALGNDFLVVDALVHDGVDPSALARELCRRHRGVGADGLLWITRGEGRIRVEVLNADGGTAETSGNGLRCAARWLVDRGHAGDGETLPLVSGAGPSPARVDGERITVSMGAPRFAAEPGGERFLAGETTWEGIAVSMGNPHLVVIADQRPADVPLEIVARAAGRLPAFPGGVNVEVADLRDPTTADVRVWERGVGETMACGSGACAVAAAARSLGRTEDPLDVRMPGGTLRVSWSGIEYDAMWLTGPAQRVFCGRTER